MQYTISPSSVRDAAVRVPGDKSISHRALMLGAIAAGTTTVRGFLPGEDCLATLAAMQSLGVAVSRNGADEVRIDGVGLAGLTASKKPLDLGNSGTAMRLMAGLLAGQPFDSTLVGDASLSARPMNRIIRPLTDMGAVIESDCDGTPPLEIRGGLRLRGIDYRLPVASAQVKSAILLAGLQADGASIVREPAVTRDHTERMLRAMGADLSVADGVVELRPGRALQAVDIDVPGDLSSATFVVLAALLADDADVLVEGVGINPTRRGVLDILTAMGADIDCRNERCMGDEPVADLRVRSSKLKGIEPDPALVPLAIDEFPALFVAAAAAEGTSRFTGLGELRVKESDRIAAMAEGLGRLGIRVTEFSDGAQIAGGQFKSGRVHSRGDHRIAMAFAVAATVAAGPVVVEDVANVETSFPGFRELLNGIGADIR